MNSRADSKVILWYGSKGWANAVLRWGIRETKNVDRVESARLAEILYFIKVLSKNGFEWQSCRLRNHYHLALKKGYFTSPQGDDPIKVGLGRGGARP